MCFFAALLLFLTPAAQAETPNQFYIQTATEVAAKMDAYACSDLIQFSSSDPKIAAMASSYGNASCHEPDHIFVCAADRDVYVAKLATSEDVEGFRGLTDDQYQMILDRVSPTMLVSITASKMGVDSLIVNSLSATSKSYLAPEGWDQDAFVILMRDGADVLVVCSYCMTGDGIVTVYSAYLPVSFGGDATIDVLADLCGETFTEIEMNETIPKNAQMAAPQNNRADH